MVYDHCAYCWLRSRRGLWRDPRNWERLCAACFGYYHREIWPRAKHAWHPDAATG